MLQPLLTQVQAFELCPNLRTLDLSFNLINRLDGLTCLSKLHELKVYDNAVRGRFMKGTYMDIYLKGREQHMLMCNDLGASDTCAHAYAHAPY